MIAHCPYVGGEGRSCCLSDVVRLSLKGFGILFSAFYLHVMQVAQEIQEEGIIGRLQ